MSGQFDSTLDEVVDTCLRIFGALQQRSVTDWMEVDLSTAQLKVLFTVNYNGPLPISRIAHIVGIGAPTASHLVEKLVQAGLLERIESDTDRRIVHAQITPAGRQITLRLRAGRADILQRWVSELAPADRVALSQGVRAVFQIMVNDLSRKDETAGACLQSFRKQSDQ